MAAKDIAQISAKCSARALNIVMRPLEALKFNPTNPRLHSRRQVRQIARSIAYFGFVVPILTNSTSNIIAGHGRALAAKELGLLEVPTICLDHLTEAQIKAFIIADNRLAENSSWDDRLLAQQLRDLSELDLDFGLEVTGFDIGEIDFRIENLEKTSPADEPEMEAMPAPGPAVTQPGDLWKLGPHRVYCGNALEANSFAVLMGNEKAAMVFTDPPYNVPIDGHVSGLGAVRHRDFVMACGEMDSPQFTKFLNQAFTLLASHSVDGSIHFHCMDWRHGLEILEAGRSVYTELKNICAWVKPNAGMGSFYRSQHELVFVFKAGHCTHQNNIQLGRHGRHRSNVWSYPGANAFGRASEEGPLFKLHPTVKPVRLVADCILDCTSPRDLILDSFLGSGTAVIAAERTGRRCYGIEIDPIYVDTIIRRWQTYSGGVTRHAQSGEPFDSRQMETSHAES